MTNNTTCLTCQHWQLKQSGDIARHKFARCAHGPIWHYLPPQHGCSKHKPVDADKAAQRLAWARG